MKTFFSFIIGLSLSTAVWGKSLQLAPSHLSGKIGLLIPLSSTKDTSRGTWSFIFEPGVTTIDFALHSRSRDFRLDGVDTDIDSNFRLYDSRQNYFPPSVGPFTDQANHYLLSAKQERYGLVFTFGILHDKREQQPNINGNKFRYRKGGANLTLQAGRQWDWNLGAKSWVYFQQRVGGFVGFNDLDISLFNPENKQSYVNSKDGRQYSGGGFVSNTQIAYAYRIKKSWSLSLSVNGTWMTGKALTKVSTVDLGANEINTGQVLSVQFYSWSLGPSLNVIYRR